MGPVDIRPGMDRGTGGAEPNDQVAMRASTCRGSKNINIEENS